MPAPNITLYLRPGWSSLFPHILLYEQNLAFETVGVTDRTVTEDRDFAAKNPKKQIPVLFIHGKAVTEIPAIAHAISRLRDSCDFMGSDRGEFVEICVWMNWISASFHAQAWSPYLRPWRFTNNPDGEAGVKLKAYTKLLQRFVTVEDALGEDGWAVGSSFSAVDAYLLPFFQWAETDRSFRDMRGDFPKYAALMERVRSRPSVQRALGREAEIKESMGGDQVFESNR